MEINQPLDSEISSLDVTPESRSYLLEAANWGRFVAIVGFVFLGLMVLGLLFMGGTFLSMGFGSEMQEFGAMGGVAVFLYLVFLFAMMFFPNLYMYKFSTRIISAINSESTIDLTEGLKNLKSLFKFYGILIAIMVVFYVLAIIGGGAAALMLGV